ncbi:P-loop containing nucleoside triphosphate hydrolase protein [Daedaleopsis nitida]|nr:P-loop containing nucleoside triphosphate hydrolase protein [Daedaleopsis nitida]
MHCPICDIQVLGTAVWRSHVDGGRHARRSRSNGIDPEDVQPAIPPESLYKQCRLCKEAVPVRSWSGHLQCKAHTRREQHAHLRSVFERGAQDKGGVTVSHSESGVDFGTVRLEDAIVGRQLDISISAPATSPSFRIVRAQVLAGGRNAIPFAVTLPASPTAYTHSIVLPVRLCHTARGQFGGVLELEFQNDGPRTFVMTRSLRCVIGEAADRDLLRPSTQYVRRRRAPWHKNAPVVCGDRPPALNATPWVKKLTRARIPSDLDHMLKTQPPEKVIAHVLRTYMQSSIALTKGNHEMTFRAMTWIEEARAVEDLHMYDLTDARFVKEGGLHTLPVEGLSEKRPSVVIGDTIMVQESNAPAGRTHEGYVHTVRLNEIRVSFHRSFDCVGKTFNVCFQFNRVPVRRQHQALVVPTPAHTRLLFPGPTQAGLSQALGHAESPLNLYNPAIAANPAQYQAVKSIVNLRRGTAPFVIFGPPGTGKTVTVVEGIKQVLRRQPTAKILACAPSNSAADLIAGSLMTALTTDEMFRCNAASRNPNTLPANLVPYTHHLGDHYGLHPRDKLTTFKLTVTTCGNASFAYNVGLPQGHYDYIFVDEAGQASEPEVLTAIKPMSGADTIVVLAGDPKQLGPVIRSSIARDLGLGKSYLERLLEMPLYNSTTGRGKSFVKLVNNYRSHIAILHYPNEKFYDNELEACGPVGEINYFIGSSQLVSPRFPIVFHAISGENEREASSPSYFNIDEASQVKAYVQALLQDAAHPIQPKDIAVVTQYHAQVLKIRKLLRVEGLQNVTVTSVENIQGQERPVIIMSTVRSSRDLLSYDAKFTLGFVSNPRRFNVAVTRAKGLLIVVGDPDVLSIDPLWRGFMNYIYARGGWRGPPPTWDVDAPVKTEGDYAEEIREAAAADMNAFMERLQIEDDLEGGANFDTPFQEAE